MIGDTPIYETHSLNGKPIRFTHHIGDIELIVWLDGYWKHFVRKTAFLRPIEPHEEKHIEELRVVGFNACKLLNSKIKKKLVKRKT